MPSSQGIIYKEEVVENPKLADEFKLIIYTTMLAVFLLCLILGMFFLIAYLFIFGLVAFFISMLIGAIFITPKTHLPIQEELYLFITFLFLLIFLMLFGFIFKSWDLLIGGLLDLTVVIFLYIVGFRPYMNYRKSVRNHVIVGRNEITIENLFRAKKGDIEI